MLVLTKKILQSYPNGFNSFIITGRRGIGKSAYSLTSLHDALEEMGMSNIQAWDAALKALKFTIPEVIAYLKEAVAADEKKVCLIWDDARVHAGGGQYFIQTKMVIKLGGLMDTIRTAVSCLILTMPSPKGLLSVLKNYDDYLVKIKYAESGGFNRVATGYLWTTLPAGQRRIYTKFHDKYSCRLPNWLYAKYMVQRKNALKDVLEDLEQEVKE